MFANFGNVEKIEFGHDFDTRNVTDMSWMFSGCSKLTSLDLSGFDTRNVTNMSGMFYRCSKLASLDIKGFYAWKVEDMRYMFSGCSSLKSVDVSRLSRKARKDGMFNDCVSLR